MSNIAIAAAPKPLATWRNVASWLGLALTGVLSFWLMGDPESYWVFFLGPLFVMAWVLPAALGVLISSHRAATTLVACALWLALFVASLLGWPFAVRFHMARPELETIAQRVLATRRDERLATQWLDGHGVWYEDGAVYFTLHQWVDDWGIVYDPRGSSSWTRFPPLAPGWYEWRS